jgi:hypothetical protein
MEAFFSSLKSELADRFDSCGEPKMELFDYVEVFYNQRRRHSTIGYLSPAAFERHASSGVVRRDGALVGTLAQSYRAAHEPIREHITIHDTRRTFASRAAEAGMAITRLAEILGSPA